MDCSSTFIARERRVVAANRDQHRDVQPQQRLDDVLEQLLVRRRIRSRDAKVRAATKVDAADLVDAERDDVIGVAAHDPFEAVANANHFDAVEPAANSRRTDHAIDARGGASAHENCKTILWIHGS